MTALALDRPAMSRDERRAWIAAAALLALCAVGWFVAPARFPFGWLAGLTLFSLWPLGSLALLYIHALTGGRWGEAIRPGLLLGAGATPLIPLLAIPVLLTLPTLYQWARPEGAALPNRFWLNPAFFAARCTIETVFWIGLSVVVHRGGLARLAPFALFGLAVTITWAAIDFTMSLDPRFISSAYGMVAGASAVLLALALAILLSPPAAPNVDGDLGRLMLALCALWTYLEFMQVLIVWQSDLVAQTPWYLARRAGLWGWVMALVPVLHGVGPILALLLPGVRRSRAGLVRVAAVIIAAAVLRNLWTALPPRLPGLVDLVCLGFVAALATAWTLRHRAHAP